MKNRKTIFTAILLAVVCLGIAPVTQARRPSEDRGNGNTAAENCVANMTLGPHELVAFLSREMTLEPGDIISTGTPGAAAITAGDVVACEISGFPPLTAPVVHDA